MTISHIWLQLKYGHEPRKVNNASRVVRSSSRIERLGIIYCTVDTFFDQRVNTFTLVDRDISSQFAKHNTSIRWYSRAFTSRASEHLQDWLMWAIRGKMISTDGRVANKKSSNASGPTRVSIIDASPGSKVGQAKSKEACLGDGEKLTQPSWSINVRSQLGLLEVKSRRRERGLAHWVREHVKQA